jgi:hypothetical protein
VTGLPWVWRATADEVAADYACDAFVDGPSVGCFRAADSTAGADELFRWFCQLRLAPYSYDLLDNSGKRSPRTLSPELQDLELGQEFMRIFRLVDFTPGRQVTLKISHPRSRRLFGDLAVSYTARSVEGGSRLVAKLALPVEDGPLEAVRRYLLAWGDLLMMQKQVRTLAWLANQSVAT